MKAIPLLPELHLALLRRIREHQWPSQYFADLLFIRFLCPSTVRWLKSSPCPNELPYMNRVLGRIGDEKEGLRKFYHILFESHSLISIPQLFLDFEIPWISSPLCINDVGLIV